jgi:hypothetical protein
MLSAFASSVAACFAFVIGGVRGLVGVGEEYRLQPGNV